MSKIAMNSRSTKILKLVISEHRNLLDLPKFESTKGTSREEQIAALHSIKEYANFDNNKPEYNKESSDEPFMSSESEFIPDTTSDSETEDSDDKEFSSTEASSSKNSIPPNIKITDLPSTLQKNNELSAENRCGTSRNVDGTIVTFGKFLASTSKVENFTNCRPWTKKNACPYCFREITHFPRHLQRNHKTEGAVKELLSMSFKDPKRKKVLDAIRRQGNFVFNSKTNIIRPVRRPKSKHDTEIAANSDNSKDKYIICQHCLGYFGRNYLRRHIKTCGLRQEGNAPGMRDHHLSAAQLFSVCSGAHNDFYSSLRIKDEVFKIMRNDDISKAAMKDILICEYGESLLRKHKRTQIRNVISNKMRELGRLLLSIKNVTGAQTLFELLKPEFFDNFVSATKIISGYNSETRTFKAGSLALHMGTTLKQVCNIATKLIIKKSYLLLIVDEDQSLKCIKRLKNLIENHWNSEISSLALKQLNENKSDKPSLLPLTSDVVKFQQYVTKEAKKLQNNLRQKNPKKSDFGLLTKCVLSLTLLLNRKRIGEIQYLTVNNYNNATSQNQQEEFLQALSESERTLTKSFKRVVTLGKGSKPVPILFSKDMQEFIDLLLNVRNLFVSQKNQYLFANPNTENKWLSGYHTLKKLAEQSGVSDTTLFTSTRLRKQISTILQVMNVTDNEMEQLASFMGHTKKTHESYYRLPQDIYQTAKVSKLLLTINSGKASKYKGKTLDEIEISDNLDTDSDSESDNITSHRNPSTMDKTTSNPNSEIVNSANLEKNVLSPGMSKDELKCSDQNLMEHEKKTKIKRIRWTQEQKKVTESFFKQHIKNKTAAKKHEVEKLISQHPKLFKNKNWVTIKAYVYNCSK